MKFITKVDKVEEIICSNGSVAFRLCQSGERTNILVFSADSDLNELLETIQLNDNSHDYQFIIEYVSYKPKGSDVFKNAFRINTIYPISI